MVSKTASISVKQTRMRVSINVDPVVGRRKGEGHTQRGRWLGVAWLEWRSYSQPEMTLYGSTMKTIQGLNNLERRKNFSSDSNLPHFT